MQEFELFYTPPSDFHPDVEVVSVFLSVGDKVLLLQRSGSERGTWGLPAGKLEAGESLVQGAQRELLEETAIQAAENQFVSIGKLFIKKTFVSYTFHVFQMELDSRPDVKLSNEHLNFGWYHHEEAIQLPLMAGAIEVLQWIQKNLNGAV